jgi:pimeloyl-ACP methyl ester carboxylesterase
VNGALIEDMGQPSMLQFSLELPRTVTEYALFFAATPLLRAVPAGDGHPVLVLPGFLADDRSTVALRSHLRRIGYPTRGWRLGRNTGPTRAVIDGMRRTIDALAAEHERTITVVGWSLGGVYARALARHHAGCIRQVITLGSPLQLARLDQTRTERMYRLYQPSHDEQYRMTTYSFVDEPLSVPATSIYTRTDGIVPWQTCLQPSGPLRENIEVYGSHCGLGHNAAAVYAIGDRLAQPEGAWRPFKPAAPIRYLYPGMS